MDEKLPEKQADVIHEPMISVSIVGQDQNTWLKREPRFIERILNSVKNFFGSDIPSTATANNEIQEAAENLVESAQQTIKSPQLINLERQANIKVKLAEVKEREANARKTTLEADLIEQEVKLREDVHNSQRIIDLLIQRGELVPIEKNGVMTFVYNKK